MYRPLERQATLQIIRRFYRRPQLLVLHRSASALVPRLARQQAEEPATTRGCVLHVDNTDNSRQLITLCCPPVLVEQNSSYMLCIVMPLLHNVFALSESIEPVHVKFS